MTQLDRISLASRLFCASAALFLSTVSRDLGAVQFTVLLTVLALVAWWASYGAAITHAWVAVADALVIAFLVGATAVEHPQLLPWLLASPLVAGLAGGVFPLLAAVTAQTLAVVLLTSTGFSADALAERAEAYAAWLVISLGIGLLGAWLRQIGLGPTASSADRSYESARRLVGQLRTVARRLPGGLDPVTIANMIQDLVASESGAEQLAVFARTEGRMLTPLTYHGVGARESLVADDSLVTTCWEEAEPVYGRYTAGLAHRVALPLRVGSRMVGVLLAQGGSFYVDGVRRVMQEVDEVALRLETALAFDDVRSLATVEERRRLAREIHDGIAQEIASLGYLVDDVAAETNDHRTAHRLSELRGELTRVVSELRLSIFDLRAGVESGTTLGTALSDYVQQVGARSNMTVHLTLDESSSRLRSEVEAELLRIVQEAVTNARKHASAKNLWVDCRIRAPWARILVRDDGGGLSPGRADSFGIHVMHERATRIGARLTLDSCPVNGMTGTTVTITLGEDDHQEGPADVPDGTRAARR